MASAKDIANRRPITAALMLATLMNTLDSTIANVALPHIQGSVSAAQDQITWVLTSYIIAAGMMTPLAGWLAQKIGRKRMFLMSIFGFTVASMLCGIATSLPEIVIFRLLQGIAGASMMPLSQTVMLDIYPPKQIPQVMAIWSSAVILGPIVGPALGGWLTENLSWRWVFFINLPIGVIAFLGLNVFMENDEGGRERPFDFLGFAALITFIGGFQMLLDRGPSQDWFASPEIWIEAALAAIGLWVFIIQTVTTKHPFFHRDLAKDRNFVTTTIFGFFTGALLYSSSALLPSMMQNLMGFSVLQSGYASMPRGLGSLIAFLSVPPAAAAVRAAAGAVRRTHHLDVRPVADESVRPDDDLDADHGLGTDPGAGHRSAVRPADDPGLCHSVAGASDRRHDRQHHGPQPGFKRRHFRDPGGIDQPDGHGPLGSCGTRPAQRPGLQFGQPGIHEPRRSPGHPDPQRRGQPTGRHDRLRRRVRRHDPDGGVHGSPAPAGPPARARGADPCRGDGLGTPGSKGLRQKPRNPSPIFAGLRGKIH